MRSSPESGERAGYDGAKRKKGSKPHLVVDTLGHVRALHVTPADAENRAEVERLAGAVQAETGDSVEPAYVGQDYTGERAADATKRHGIPLEVVKLPEAKKGFVLLPRRWVVERSFAWATGFRRLVKDDERCPATLEGLHILAFVCLVLKKAACLPQIYDSLQALAQMAQDLRCNRSAPTEHYTAWAGAFPRRRQMCIGC